MKTILLLATLPCLLLTACSPTSAPPPPSASSPEELTPDERAAATALGKAIAMETFSVLSSNLQSAITSGGVSNALPYCSLAASPLTSSIAERRGVSLQRVTHKPRNPAARADATEQAVLDRFRAQLQAGDTPVPFSTNLVSNQATFFAPIVLNNELCLNCHGVPEQDIQPSNLAIIRNLYPQDEATGFALGELRGAWRIDIPLAVLDAAPEATGTE